MSENNTILICDDEAHIRHVVRLKLQNAGYNVLVANDGQEGLDLAIQHKPDLIITDFQMPRMTGVEMCAKLKDNPDTTRIPAIMLTARGFTLEDNLSGKTNIGSVLSKPFSPREILSRVQQALSPTPQPTG